MGHGAPAALVTAMAYSVIMTISDLFNQNSLEPKEILHKLNNIIFHAVEGTISMTAFAMILDYERRTVTYSNAGHNFPIFIPKNPHDIRCASSKSGSKKYTHKVGNMNVMGTILGIAANTEFNQKTMNILPGDRFFLFTDGLIECKSPTGQAWSRKKLTECLLENALLDGAKLKDTVVNKAFSFFNKVPLLDDITVVVVEVLESLAQLPAKDELTTSAETKVNSIAKLNVIKDTVPPVPAVPAAGHKNLTKDSAPQPTEDLLARVKALRHKVS
jgi:serine phosphatase RsbU (regulator of sigma subunit)